MTALRKILRVLNCISINARFASVALQSLIFPIDQPVMPEERQIGRGPAIDRLETELRGIVHQWIIGERRIGKTSVARAVLARLSDSGHLALDLDLSRLELDTPEDLAEEIARQASTQDPAFAVEPGDAQGLGQVLVTLAEHARASGQRAFVLLDEVHLLDDVDHAAGHVAHACHEPESPIVFVFAGSERSAVEALRELGRPLAAVGREFKLPEIAPEDWLYGLRARFEEAGVEIARTQLEAIVAASGGHPRRTMLIASNVYASAQSQPDAAASDALVELAIRDAREDRAWH